MKIEENERHIPVMYLYCTKCGHTWIPRKETIPRCCPRCKSYDWEFRTYEKQLFLDNFGGC